MSSYDKIQLMWTQIYRSSRSTNPILLLAWTELNLIHTNQMVIFVDKFFFFMTFLMIQNYYF